MCIPGDHGAGTPIIPYVHFFNTTPIEQQPPERPPYQRHRVQRPHPMRMALPEPPRTLRAAAAPVNVAPVAATPKPTRKIVYYCECHDTPESMRLCALRRSTDTADVKLSIRLLITLAIAIVVSKLISDYMYPPGVDGSLVGDPPSFRVKRQLPPIEQGNMVIDSIFQIPINTLSAVGTLIKTARPLVRRTRERIQQYYNSGYQRPSYTSGGQQQYGNGQQQYGNGQQYYGNGQQYYSNGQQYYSNGQQYYTNGRKRYSIGRQSSDANADALSRHDDAGEGFVNRAKRMKAIHQSSGRTYSAEGRMLRLQHESPDY